MEGTRMRLNRGPWTFQDPLETQTFSINPLPERETYQWSTKGPQHYPAVPISIIAADGHLHHGVILLPSNPLGSNELIAPVFQGNNMNQNSFNINTWGIERNISPEFNIESLPNRFIPANDMLRPIPSDQTILMGNPTGLHGRATQLSAPMPDFRIDQPVFGDGQNIGGHMFDNRMLDENVFQDREIGNQLPPQFDFDGFEGMFLTVVGGTKATTSVRPHELSHEIPEYSTTIGNHANIGINDQVQPSATDKIFCTHSGCSVSFKRNADRIRHDTSVHGINQGPHFCPIAGCDKSEGIGVGFCRSDKVKEHLWKKHANLGYVKGRM